MAHGSLIARRSCIKTEAGRKKKIEAFVAMLARGQTVQARCGQGTRSAPERYRFHLNPQYRDGRAAGTTAHSVAATRALPCAIASLGHRQQRKLRRWRTEEPGRELNFI